MTFPVAGPGRTRATAGSAGVPYRTETAEALRPTAIMLSVLLVSFWAMHRLVLGAELGAAQDLTLVVATVVAVTVARLTRRDRIPEGAVSPTMLLLAGVALVFASLHLVGVGERSESAPFLFLLVGLGVTVLERRWFVPGVVAVWVAWLASVHTLGGGWHSWAHWGFSMATATALAVTLLVIRRRSVRAAAEALEHAVRDATHDPATGLANRRGLALLADQVLARARRDGEPVHCTFFDIDGLKAVNDSYGHVEGDRVILAVAQAIRSTCRADDVVARWGGDEFVVVGVGRGPATDRLEGAVASHLAEHHPVGDVVHQVRISAGAAELGPSDPEGADVLLWRADHDMYLRRGERRGLGTLGH